MRSDFDVEGYEIEGLLGAGPTGETWLAREAGSGVQVALHRIRPRDAEAVDQARRLVERLNALNHPHIRRVRELLPYDDELVFVLDHVDGSTLEQLLLVRGTLDPGEVVTAAATVAGALAAAHERGLVHGDLRPEDILFQPDGTPLITDIGFGRIAAPSPDAPAREFADPAEPVDGEPTPAGDVYSLSAICYMALTGLVPRPGAVRPIHQVAPGIPPGLAHAIQAGLQPAWDMRPPMSQLVSLIEAASGRMPVRLPDTGPTDAPGADYGPGAPYAPGAPAFGSTSPYPPSAPPFASPPPYGQNAPFSQGGSVQAGPTGRRDPGAPPHGPGYGPVPPRPTHGGPPSPPPGARPGQAGPGHPGPSHATPGAPGHGGPGHVGPGPRPPLAGPRPGTPPDIRGPEHAHGHEPGPRSAYAPPPGARPGPDGPPHQPGRHEAGAPESGGRSLFAGLSDAPEARRGSPRSGLGLDDTSDGEGSQTSRLIMIGGVVVVAIALVVTLIVWQVSTDSTPTADETRTAAPTATPSRTPSPTPTPRPTLTFDDEFSQRWYNVMLLFDERRTEAFAKNDPSLLGGLYAPNSEALAADTQRMQTLAQHNVRRVENLTRTITSMVLVSELDDSVTFEVERREEPYTLVMRDGKRVDCPGSPSQTIRIEFVPLEGSTAWRVAREWRVDEQPLTEVAVCES